jgi:hypothetical protein
MCNKRTQRDAGELVSDYGSTFSENIGLLIAMKSVHFSAFAQVKSRARTKRNTAVVEAGYNWFAV